MHKPLSQKLLLVLDAPRAQLDESFQGSGLSGQCGCRVGREESELSPGEQL